MKIAFCPLTRADFPLLTAWLEQPHVLRWWNHDTAPAAVEADFGPSIDGVDRAELFIALLEGRPIGYIQRYTFADNPGYVEELEHLIHAPGAALSIDYFIGEPGLLRQGWGAAMIRAFVTDIWRDYPQAPAVIVPVNAANPASWRVLERAGFSKAAEGALTPDNPIDDRHHYIYVVERSGPAG